MTRKIASRPSRNRSSGPGTVPLRVMAVPRRLPNGNCSSRITKSMAFAAASPAGLAFNPLFSNAYAGKIRCSPASRPRAAELRMKPRRVSLWTLRFIIIQTYSIANFDSARLSSKISLARAGSDATRRSPPLKQWGWRRSYNRVRLPCNAVLRRQSFFLTCFTCGRPSPLQAGCPPVALSHPSHR